MPTLGPGGSFFTTARSCPAVVHNGGLVHPLLPAPLHPDYDEELFTGLHPQAALPFPPRSSSSKGAPYNYLVVRRALGFRLERAEKLLGQFVAYCDDNAIATVTTEAAVAWATLPVEGSPGWRGQRLSVVRAFAAWLQAHDPATEVPPADVIGPVASRRAVPTSTPTPR